ncbi:MAG TPA: hypothetical protein VN680_04235 [Burkholderiaceae bacterium]|jgi:hypothetical protein|nr:hypothetical protein [Burkholderiaceae bacterium]
MNDTPSSSSEPRDDTRHPHQRAVLYVVALAVVLGLMGFFGHSPLGNDITAADVDIDMPSALAAGSYSPTGPDAAPGGPEAPASRFDAGALRSWQDTADSRAQHEAHRYLFSE